MINITIGLALGWLNYAIGNPLLALLCWFIVIFMLFTQFRRGF